LLIIHYDYEFMILIVFVIVVW